LVTVARREVNVEMGNSDNTDSIRSTFRIPSALDNPGGGTLFVQSHVASTQIDSLQRTAAELRDLQTYDGVRLAAKELDDIGQSHADHICHPSFWTLTDANNPVAQLQPTVSVRWSTGHDGLHDRIPAVASQSQANVHQVQLTYDVEWLQRAGRQVSAVRIERTGQRCEEYLSQPLVIRLTCLLGEIEISSETDQEFRQSSNFEILGDFRCCCVWVS
jgi:hypothetical protein